MANPDIERAKSAKSALEANRRSVLKFVQGAGKERTQELLERTAKDLERKLARVESSGAGPESFTAAQVRATLAQVKDSLRGFLPDFREVIVDSATESARHSVNQTIDYLVEADKAFRGLGEQRLALPEAEMMEESVKGARASVLRRIATSGTPEKDALPTEHPGKMGVLERYGVETIKAFEDVLQRGMLSKKSWIEMRGELTSASPFLQGKPEWWAQRIVRTESMAAYNAAGAQSIKVCNQELGDLVKILSATFDERTAADSYAVHGQIRRLEESFETWYGDMDHPPARPNDREIVVPHRIAWVIPEYLAWKDDGEIEERWTTHDKRKGSPPERPLMTTVDLELFGKESEEATPVEEAEKRGEGDSSEHPEEDKPERDEDQERADVIAREYGVEVEKEGDEWVVSNADEDLEGRGETPDDALRDYLDKLQEKREREEEKRDSDGN